MTPTQDTVTMVVTFPVSDAYLANRQLLDNLVKGLNTAPGLLGIYAGEQIEDGDGEQKFLWLFAGLRSVPPISTHSP
jgi:hypothetical protein